MKKFIGFSFVLLLTFGSLYSAPAHTMPAISTSFWSRALQAARSYGQTFLAAAQKTVSLHVTKNGIAKVGFIAAAAAISFYGFKLAKRYFQKPHATVVKEAEAALNNLEPFKPLIEKYQECDLNPNTPVESISEDILEALAVAKNTTSLNLDKLITDLESRAKIIQERITQIDQSTPTNKALLEDMTRIDRRINQVLPRLKSLQSIILQRQDYFQLFDTVAKASALAIQAGNQYAPLLKLCEEHYGKTFTGNELANEDMLGNFAVIKGSAHNILMTSLQGTIVSLQRDLKILNGNTRPYKGIREKHLNLFAFAQQLSALQQFMQNNSSCFILFDTVIAAQQAYDGDSTQLKLPGNTLYPHLTFIQKLNKDLEDLDQANKGVLISAAPIYPKIYNFAQNLIERLTLYRDAVISSPSYAEELRAKNTADQEEQHRQEKLAIQRKAAADERRHQEEQLFLQKKQLHIQQKGHDLSTLLQSLQAGTITKKQYESQKSSIESSYFAQELTDNAFHACGIQ